MVTASNGNMTITRNESAFKRINENLTGQQSRCTSTFNSDYDEEFELSDMTSSEEDHMTNNDEQ